MPKFLLCVSFTSLINTFDTPVVSLPNEIAPSNGNKVKLANETRWSDPQFSILNPSIETLSLAPTRNLAPPGCSKSWRR